MPKLTSEKQTFSLAKKENLLPLSLGALGVVYGDIGTSPLYALSACFSGEYSVSPTLENITGVLSLVFWSITWVVVVKYLTVLMRANNEGEGGIMALLSLLTPRDYSNRKKGLHRTGIILFGLFGAALLYGDGVITPAVSVLSAVEGLEIVTPFFRPYIVPLTVVILVGLFLAQKKGTEKVGAIFGPMMIVWFASISAVALPWLFRQPAVFLSLNPWLGIQFFIRNGYQSLFVLTAVVLCVTGAEALYADMGHFGAKPIRLAWYFIVYPALIVNYFGQGALLLDPAHHNVTNPFFAMVPHWFLIPMVIIATCATVIASQALISGVFSMTHQAISLGFLPRFRVIHTSEDQERQIFIPKLNQFLLISCISLVLAFQSSTRLIGAYGIAVSGTMAITSFLFYRVARDLWKWTIWSAGGLTLLFLFVDFSLLIPNLSKIASGGWVPIAIAIVFFVVILQDRALRAMPIGPFIQKIVRGKVHRVEGTAIFLATQPGIAPSVLLHHLNHNKVIHERVIILVLSVQHIPFTDAQEHGKVEELGHGFFQVVANYGFIQRPNLRDILDACARVGVAIEEKDMSFYLNRDILRTHGKSKMAKWRKQLYIFTANNSQPVMEFFGVEPDWVVEIGALVEI
jgi:KUP system potassium uptake protein